MADKQIKLGVIGIGVGAAEMLPAMESADYINLYAGADLNPDVRARFHERYPEARVYASADELLKDPEVDAVWISTPNMYHAPMAIQAAQHGKHVVVEKPMALDMRQAEEMVEAAEKNGVKLVAGHTQSFSPQFRLMRQIVRSGELGELGAISDIGMNWYGIFPSTISRVSHPDWQDRMAAIRTETNQAELDSLLKEAAAYMHDQAWAIFAYRIPLVFGLHPDIADLTWGPSWEPRLRDARVLAAR